MQHSLGLIEVSGMSLAITVADVMAKTALVRLIGVERTIGSGWMLVKIAGDVAAVRTALSAGEETAREHQGFVARTTIARPAKGTSELVSATKPPQAEPVQKATVLPSIAVSAAHTSTGPESVQENPDADKAAPPYRECVGSIPDNIVQGNAIDEPMHTVGKPGAPNDSVKSPAADYGGKQAEAMIEAFKITKDIAADQDIATASAKSIAVKQHVKPGISQHQAHPQVKPDGETANTGSQRAGETKQDAATSTKLLVTCKICGDPSCPRHKGQPRSRCIHNQQSVLR